MSLIIPPAKNYQSPIVAQPSRWRQSPIEGPKSINCEIDWSVMGGASQCCSFNLQNNATLAFSQIVAMSFDNSGCNADVEVIFPDTGYTVTIPALAPGVITPVFTNGQQFWVSAPEALATDVTRFQIHNSMPPPLAIPRSVLQETSFSGAVDFVNTPGPGYVTIIPAGISGTLEMIQINLASGSAVTSAVTGGFVNVYENAPVTPHTLFQTGVIVNNANLNFNLISLNPINRRFTNGLYIGVSGITSGGGLLWANMAYRTP